MALLKTSAGAPANRNWRDTSRIWFAVASLLFLGALDASAQMAPSKEYQVKAVFLFNFAQFVTWPANAFPGTQAPLVIGILGDDPFGAFLDETVRGERVNNRPLVIQRYRRAADIKACHILFISQSEAKRLDQIFADLKDRNILTVGDAEHFTSRGGMVRFIMKNKKIRLRINLAAAKAARLTISSKLLRPSEIVAPGKD